jgi:hypothetical protein
LHNGWSNGWIYYRDNLRAEKMTQTQQILNHLQLGKTITPLEALDLYGCLRLGARIWDIKQLGYDVNTKIKVVGQHKHVAEYSF